MTPTTVASGMEEEQIVKLSPFEVSTTRNVGYQAMETLAGTRIRTDLKDVGASIAVLTKEFLDDIGATDTGTLLQYTTNAEVAGTRGTYAGLGNSVSVDESGNLRTPAGAQRMRGLAAADNTRDFYITDIPWDSYNVDRIDILRGPNSILYGLGSPAGIVNASTRSAEFQNRGEVTARVGSYGAARATLDLNQQLINNVLAIRVDGLWKDEKFEQKPAFEDDKRLYGALRFDPQLFKNRAFHTSIRAKWEHGEINANRPRIIPPNDSITPWFNPTAITADNPFSGMGRMLINNPYDPYRTDNIVAGSSRGVSNSTTANYQPWITDPPNQQQAFWLVDGTTNQLYGVNGGYINNGARYSTGGFSGISGGIVGKRQNGMFYGLQDLPTAVTNAHNANAALFPLCVYGVYKRLSLLDPSVFDFYHTLIDGPTKWEFEKWNAYNLDFTQTAWDDRVGVELSYDRQKYKNGAEQLLGGSPTLSLSILQNYPDYLWNPGNAGVNNPNVGRPYVQAGSGSGRNYYTDREYRRASLFGELRVSDLTSNNFLVKLLGKHRFNAVGSDEKFFNENRAWQMVANSQAWDGYWNGTDGASSGINNRSPQMFVFLGSSIANRTSASGANIPGITAPVAYQDHGVYVMDSTWRNPTGVAYGDVWTIPASLQMLFDANVRPTVNSVQYANWTQSSNPDNYVGWNSNFQDQLLRYNNGQDDSLLTTAQKSLRETISYSGSYQGFFWNNALVATLGWRYDEVKTKDVTAQNVTFNRNMLNLQPSVYRLPDSYPASQIMKGHSTSGGAVLHLNQILPHDPLPINVSVSYNESSNFQITSVRRDLYGTPFGNPTGKTYEYGLFLSTKDGKYSFRGVKYTTRTKNGNSQLANASGLGGIISNGLNWRNIFLYQLSGYDWSGRNAPSYRNVWTNAYPAETQAQADAEVNSCITTWNNIQTWLAAKGFFQAWNFTPTGPVSALVDRTTYLSNPTAYAPDATTISNYGATAPQGFTVTADTESKGYELELTANPLPNWRVSFNASKTEAVRNNVGGATLTEFINYMDSQMYSAPGVLSPAGMLPRWGGAGNSIGASVYAVWRANYVLMRLQEGTAAPEIRKWRYNIVTSYDFSKDFLKGVGVGGAYRWQDKVVIGYPCLANGTYDLTQPYYGPSEDAIDLWASYTRKLTPKINWKIQLNVRNAFAKHGLIPISIEPDGNTWASVRVKPIQEWFVTNTFSF
jgi:outer membrane receptor protein involved in Fe transport